MTRSVRSTEQLKASIRNHLREAFAMDYDDDEQIDYAARMMGEEYRALISKVHAGLKPTEPI